MPPASAGTGDLLLPGRRQVLAGQGGQLGRRAGPAEVMKHRRALVEQHRVHALHPRGVLGAQVVIALQQRPALQHLRRRDPALRQPALGQQVTQQPRVRPVGLGPLLAAACRRGIGRLGQVRLHARALQLPDHIPPARARLHRERDIVRMREPAGQPGPQMLPVRRGDLTALHLPGHQVHIVEGDLLPVDI